MVQWGIWPLRDCFKIYKDTYQSFDFLFEGKIVLLVTFFLKSPRMSEAALVACLYSSSLSGINE